MKFTTPIALASSIILATGVAGAQAHAQERSWYVRGDLGGGFNGQFDKNRGLDLKDSAFGAAGVGYDLGNGLRFEGEMTYTKADVEKASGDASTLGGFANVVYDFNTPGRVKPFVGAGVGVARVKLDSGPVDDSDTGFAYQAKAGVSYKVNARLTAEAAYRYQRVDDLKFGSGGYGANGDFDTQAFTVGLRYKLGR